MDKLVDKYLKEGKENSIARMLEKKFGVKIKKVDVKRRITFTLAKGIDEDDFDNFGLIDNIHKTLKKTFKPATTEHDYNKFIVEEL